MSAVPTGIPPGVLSAMDEGLASSRTQLDVFLAAYRQDRANVDETVAAYRLATEFLKMPNTPATWTYVLDLLVVAVTRLASVPTMEERL